MSPFSIALSSWLCFKAPVRIDRHPHEAFLEHDPQVRTMVRIAARERPLGEPCRELTLDDLRRYIDDRMENVEHPLTLVMRRMIDRANEAQEKVRRHDLKRPRLVEDAAARISDLVEVVRAIEQYDEAGDVCEAVLIEITAASEEIIADVTPSNLVRDPAEGLAAIADQFGFEREVDRNDPSDGTERVTFRRRKERPFSQEQIRACVHERQREMLARPRSQRRIEAAAAIELLRSFNVLRDLPFTPDDRRVIVAAIRRFADVQHPGPVTIESCARVGISQSPAQPSGP